MSVLVNVHMSKIMRTPIKLGVRTYAKYANCRTLNVFFFWNFFNELQHLTASGTCSHSNILGAYCLTELRHAFLVINVLFQNVIFIKVLPQLAITCSKLTLKP